MIDNGRDQLAENEAEVRAALDKRLKRKGAAREMDEMLGLTESYISQMRKGPVPPKVAYGLGYRRVVRWEKLS